MVRCAALEQQVQRAGLAQQAIFLGTRNDLPQQLRELDLFVLASDREGRPTSIMEAMSAGLPIVATNVGSVNELVADGEDGFVVNAGDPASLAKAMQSLIEHQELRAKMSEAARKKRSRIFRSNRCTAITECSTTISSAAASVAGTRLNPRSSNEPAKKPGFFGKAGLLARDQLGLLNRFKRQRDSFLCAVLPDSSIRTV